MPRNQKSALYFYAIEMGERKKVKGTVKELIEMFYQDWKNLSSYEKSKYERKFEEYKRNQSLASFSSNASIAKSQQVSDEILPGTRRGLIVEELKEFNARIIKAIYNNESGKKVESSTGKSRPITDQPWYIIKFETFCKSEASPHSKIYDYKPFYYVLAEVGIVEYSLQEGIISTYHKFIKPNEVPLGYRSACMDAEKNGHQIPMDNFTYAQPYLTYPEIYAEIKQFLRPRDSNNHFAPLFCLANDVDSTRFALQFLHVNATNTTEESPLTRQIYDLECLYVFLSNLRSAGVAYESAHELFKQYTFDYAADTVCEYHEKKSVTMCALGTCRRSAYLISDTLLILFDIKVGDKHLPIERETGVRVTHLGQDQFRVPVNRSVMTSSRYGGGSQYGSKKRDDDSDDNMEDAIRYNSEKVIRNDDYGGLVGDNNSNYRFASADIRYQQQQNRPTASQTTAPFRQGRMTVADRFDESRHTEKSRAYAAQSNVMASSNMSVLKSANIIDENLQTDHVDEVNKWKLVGSQNRKPNSIGKATLQESQGIAVCRLNDYEDADSGEPMQVAKSATSEVSGVISSVAGYSAAASTSNLSSGLQTVNTTSIKSFGRGRGFGIIRK